MKIRMRVILVIILINIVIIFTSVLAGTVYVRTNVNRYIETDMLVVADIANQFIGSELDLLRARADIMVHSLTNINRSEWQNEIKNFETQFLQFIGFSVLDESGAVIASAGEFPGGADIIGDKYIRQAFSGKKSFTSTIPYEDKGVVFYLATPIPDTQNLILALTLDGLYFSNLTNEFVIWETGHIFIDDNEGNIIANIRPEWVQQRRNFINISATESEYIPLSTMLKSALQGDRGIGYYTIAGAPRICAYRPITESEEGWILGIVAPTAESPITDVDRGLMMIGLICVALSAIAAIIASKFIEKPFKEVAALKEQADEANRYKSSFLATMSHEIRTPMNVILGVTESRMISGMLPKTTQEDFEKIHSSGSTLLRLINDILDLSKIESGKLEISPVKYEVPSLINDAANLNMMQFDSKSIAFKLSVDENLPMMLHGDEIRVKQILNNLLSNALKYTDSGTVALSFECESLPAQHDSITLVLRVTDTGQGMTREQLDKLFDDYTRFNMEANRAKTGTGLGMAITHNLVKMMKGEILVDSIPGKGTKFTVRIPQGISGNITMGKELADNLQHLHFGEIAKAKQKKVQRTYMPYGKVLVVDDMATNIDVARLLLAPYGLNIETAESGFEAVNLVESGKEYDIIFMDHMMPGMDGIEATVKIRGLGYKHPIVALTANAVLGQADIFLASGFDDFISKPIDTRQLNSVLNRLIRDRHSPEALAEAAQKMNGAANDTIEAVKSIEPPEPKIIIDGIDVDCALSLYDDDVDIFVSALRSFLVNAPGVIDKLRQVSEENLPNYAVAAHGIKAMCANIGAERAKEDAMYLEEVAKAGNLQEVEKRNADFINEAEKLVNNISTWMIRKA